MKFFTALVISALSSMMLSGCASSSVTTTAQPASGSVVVPEARLVDYLSMRCVDIWRIENSAAMTNPLYWMRSIDCAERLSPAEARAEAHRWPVDSWSRAFKQGVLMANGNVTPLERRDYINVLDGYSEQFPPNMRALIQLWRSNQVAQLELSAMRSRYAHLQQSSDAQSDSLRQQQIKLRQQLSDTQRKLERLTDIERQLSSRKTSDMPDGSHGTALPQEEDQ
ncbi:two-component system QseEF-associated lipoprotein QseG [Pantoea ananatis]|uniref:two-component system QseEF-associated lipoprotein QseG n=1 Tax=Pantoea ananas TaxID=553 RepID=UPI001B30C2BF|nr:two-component system QseEF-associated lipoprotein QseG [Pantoea ananatis]